MKKLFLCLLMLVSMSANAQVINEGFWVMEKSSNGPMNPRFYIYGTKEKSYVEGMRAMKSMCPSLRRVKTGAFSHNELMVTQPDVYARLVRRILNENKDTDLKKVGANGNDGGKNDGRNDGVA